jgi:hypothetical protein
MRCCTKMLTNIVNFICLSNTQINHIFPVKVSKTYAIFLMTIFGMTKRENSFLKKRYCYLLYIPEKVMKNFFTNFPLEIWETLDKNSPYMTKKNVNIIKIWLNAVADSRQQ